MTHTVKSKDTLSGIAKKYGTTIAAIMAANPIIKNPNIIVDGWVLNIPSASGGNTQKDRDAELGAAVRRLFKDVDKLAAAHRITELLADE